MSVYHAARGERDSYFFLCHAGKRVAFAKCYRTDGCGDITVD